MKAAGGLRLSRGTGSIKRSLWVGKVLSHLLVIGLSVIFLLPFLWMLSTSLKDGGDIWLYPPRWIPNPIVWSNYTEAMKAAPFLTYSLNTVKITALVIIGTMVSCALVAYGFARGRFVGKNVLFLVLLSTMMIPYPVTLVPVFMLYRHLGWINTHLPLIVPAYFGSPFFIFLLRQFFMTIPRDLDDAARIDGCSSLQIFYQIMLPLAKPVLVTIAVFTFIGTWNDFLAPLIYLNSREMFTLALGLANFQGMFKTDWNLMMAASVMVMLPCLTLFFIAQKYFVEGITVTGMKG